MYKYIASCPSFKAEVVNNQPVKVAVDAVEDSFVLNKYGHIRSDFAVLAESSSNLEMARALQQMQSMYEESSSQFDGMTFEEMVNAVRPRWCQLPNEVDRFEQYLIDNALDFYKKLRADEEDTLKDEGVETPSKPATLGGTPQSEES